MTAAPEVDIVTMLFVTLELFSDSVPVLMTAFAPVPPVMLTFVNAKVPEFLIAVVVNPLNSMPETLAFPLTLIPLYDPALPEIVS